MVFVAMTTTMTPVRLLVSGVPPLMGAGLRALLEPYDEQVELVVGPCQAGPVDLVLVDLGHEASVAGRIYAASRHGVPVLALLPVGDADGAADALRSGAAGTVWYSVGVEELLDTVSRVASGTALEEESPADRAASHELRVAGLSERESQVLDLIASGLSNDEIARRLYVSINTVKTYVRTSYRKIGVTTRSQAVSWRIRHGHAARTTPSDAYVG